MDGVMADVYSQYIRMESEETGLQLKREDLRGKTESEAFPHYDKHVRTKGFFRTAPTMEGSVKGMHYLNDRYDLYIVSSATEYPKSLIEKYDWLNQYYPFISWEQMIFCGRKDPVKGDIMIDDHTKNLDSFEGKRILFTQPHNYYIDDEKYIRMNSWKEIEKLL